MILSLILALLIVFVISDPYHGLIISQMVLSIQLPFTIVMQIWLTSSRKVMGKYVNKRFTTAVLLTVASVVVFLNLRLLISLF